MLSLLLAGAWSCGGEPTAVGGGGVRERWHEAQPGYGHARPVVAGGLVYFGTGDGQVIARDVGTGAPRWAAKVGSDAVEGANFVARGGVVAVALDRTTGRELWRMVLPPVGQGASITGAPAITGSLAIAITRIGETYAVDRSTRRIVWRLEAPGRTQVTPAQTEVYGDAVYVDGGDRHIYALQASDGAVLWRAAFASQATRNLLVTERRVLVPEGARLHVFERRTGRLVVTTTQPYVAESNALLASPAVSAAGQTFIAVNGAAWSFDEP